MSKNLKIKPREIQRYRNGKAPLHSAEAILEKTLNYKRLSKTLRRYSLFIDWDEVVGPRIAEVAKPKKIIRGSTLLVEVVDAIWVQELSLEKTSLLKQINESCEGLLVDDIRFVAGSLK